MATVVSLGRRENQLPLGKPALPAMFPGLLVIVLGLTLIQSSFAQTFGEITGVVTDTSGAVVAGATVTVTNTQTNATRTAVTNSVGNYSFPALQPGVYSVKVEIQGFQPEIRSAVELQVQQVARLDFQLSVGAVSTAVEVTGGAPLLATENATVGTVIENQRIVDLPLNGRNFTSLIALSPNVTSGFAASGGASTRQGGDRTTIAQIAVSGQRQVYNYYTLDGIVNTDPNFNTYTFLPSIDAIQEFKVQTGIYSAEFGHQASQINVSTKSGTNQYHGALFDFVRNNYFDARPFGFTSSVPASAPFKWNQFGFYLGGPVQIPKLFNGKNRLFFMSNYEGFRLRNQTQTVYSHTTGRDAQRRFLADPAKDRDHRSLKQQRAVPRKHDPEQSFRPRRSGAAGVLPCAQYSWSGVIEQLPGAG